MPETPTLESLLKRDRAIMLAGLAVLCALSWLYIVKGAGLGMSASEMTTLALFPHRHAHQAKPMCCTDMGPGASAPWSLATWTLMIAMWWIMMIAMMTPSAAPTILLYGHVYRHTLAQGQAQHALAPTGTFAGGYLLAWLGFSVAATVLHWGLERAGLVSAMMMDSQSRWLSAGVLFAAGIYQITPFKNVCLSHCRAPTSFLSLHWRPHAWGAIRLGVLHGAYCVGCCWVLMALLFVGGVMNLIWIAALGVLVLIEKALPSGLWIGRITGVALIGWGIATIMR